MPAWIKLWSRGLDQTAACCRKQSQRNLYFEIIQTGFTRNADTKPRVCASPVYVCDMVFRSGACGAFTRIPHAFDPCFRFRGQTSVF